MAARLASPRIPAGGVGLAIRARMTRSLWDAIIQRPPSARRRRAGRARVPGWARQDEAGGPLAP